MYHFLLALPTCEPYAKVKVRISRSKQNSSDLLPNIIQQSRFCINEAILYENKNYNYTFIIYIVGARWLTVGVSNVNPRYAETSRPTFIEDLESENYTA